MSEKASKDLSLIGDKKDNKNSLIEKYQYNLGENETIINDRPSTPLNKNTDIKVIKSISNKELYESYMKELKFFSLSLNNDIIYDSSIDKSKESPVKFENDYFILYGKKYSYNGLKIQKINKR